MSNYLYAHTNYETITEVENAATEMKAALDNRPSEWCVVKPVVSLKTITIDGQDLVAYEYGEPLNDAQVLALDTSETLYNVYSVHDGDNFTNISESDAVTKVAAMRTRYAQWKEVNKYFNARMPDHSVEEFDITNEDLSSYVA